MTEAPRSYRDSVCAVVEDDASVCDSLGMMLESSGFAVHLYTSGAEFLAAPQRRIGYLIVDQHMPGISGLDVVAALRRRGIFVPTVLITGRPDPDVEQRAEQLGVRVLAKPFSLARLLDLLPAAEQRP
jgi:two-component system response regulator FixJ